jgi:hypothetical protein
MLLKVFFLLDPENHPVSIKRRMVIKEKNISSTGMKSSLLSASLCEV